MEDRSLARAAPVTPLPFVPPEAEPFRRMSVYSESGFAEQTGRLGELAVVSCGYKGKSSTGKDIPRASRFEDKKQIHLHDPYGRASGLRKALEASEHRQLLITFPDDNPAVFIRQRMMLRSSSRVQIYGDELGNLTLIGRLTENNGRLQIQPPVEGERLAHQRIMVGDEHYDRLKSACKVETRIYFNLAEWDDKGQPVVVFPDGLGVYAIRTTSAHTVDEITGYLDYMRHFTGGQRDARGRIQGGRIAGIPLRLEVVYRDVPDPGGSRRTIPIFTISTKPPEGVTLTGRMFRQIAEAGLQESEGMRIIAAGLPGPNALPAPQDDPFDRTMGELLEPDDRELAMLSTGAPADWPGFTRSWHARTNGTSFDERYPGGLEARSEFLKTWSDGAITELEDVRGLSQAEADRLIADLSERLARLAMPMQARRYDEIFDEDEPLEVRAARAPRTPAVVDVPPKTPDAEPAARTKASAAGSIRGGSALGQAFQADLARARELEVPADEIAPFVIATWPAERSEVEQKRGGLRRLISAAEGARAEETSSAPQSQDAESTAAAEADATLGDVQQPASEVWDGEIPAELDTTAKEGHVDEAPPMF